MINYGTFAVADGHTAVENLTLCCLLNVDLTDSFSVSENVGNQSFTVKISGPADADGAICGIPAREIDKGAIFFIQSKIQSEKVFSVKYCQSGCYAVRRIVSDLVSITINVLCGVSAAIRRCIKRKFSNMKGRQNRSMVYTLRLLRL